VKESLDLLQNDMLHLKEHLLRIKLRMQPLLLPDGISELGTLFEPALDSLEEKAAASSVLFSIGAPLGGAYRSEEDLDFLSLSLKFTLESVL
jgi:hypothetical protein